MKRAIFITSILLLAICIQAQPVKLTPELSIQGVLKAKYKGNEKGTPVILQQVYATKEFQSRDHYNVQAMTSIDGKPVIIPIKKASKILDLTPRNTEEFWISEYFKCRMFEQYNNVSDKRSTIRKELALDANDYLNELGDVFYKDAYIQDYIQTIFAGIAPNNLECIRHDQLTVEILQSPNPDVHLLPNGTLLISTGLLSTIDSVEELTAIIASEIAHYVLDHQVINTNKERNRVMRANFWGVALGLAAVGTEIAIASNDDHYYPGAILITSGVAGAVISATAFNQLGMGYSDKQYFEADDIAIKFMKLHGMNPGALASSLHKIRSYYIKAKDDYALSGEGGYGNVDQRISRLGEIKSVANESFHQKMSSVTTVNAIIQLNSKNYKAAEELANKNITTGFASDEDYLILVKSRMNYLNGPEDNLKNLELIRHAKSISEITNLGLYKQEILLLLRLDKQTEAINVINEYAKKLTEFKQQSESEEDTKWANEELNWANKLYKQYRNY